MQAQQRGHVLGVDAREHRDAQLVAPEFAIGIGVDDPVGAQDPRYLIGVDVVAEVDRAHDETALGRVLHEGRGELRRLGPGVEDLARTGASGRR